MTVTTVSERAPAAFSDRLRAASWGAHEAAARSPVMRALFARELPVTAYAAVAARLVPVYAALEAGAADAVADPAVAAVVGDCAVLPRTPALHRDLADLVGPARAAGLVAEAAADPVVARYADRIRDVARAWPAGYVAHHYTRVMGDLSGGRAIAHVLARDHGLTAARGASFYAFDRVGDPDAYKARYRAALDDAPWDEAEQERIVAEVLGAYRANHELLAGVPVDPRGA
ncbi:MAG: biliverdin-producing heme oxygenase [Acidimicrobiia bacterium]|nr:MAG: biliverdin-producing heme oxygenase [Acidimicrobiia bacterium]